MVGLTRLTSAKDNDKVCQRTSLTHSQSLIRTHSHSHSHSSHFISPPSQLAMLFDVYDIDGTGEVGVQELLHFVARESQELLNAAQFTKELFYNVLDRNTDGVVTQDEFLEALLMDPVMYDCFAKSLVAGIVRTPAAVCVCTCVRASSCYRYSLECCCLPSAW